MKQQTPSKFVGTDNPRDLRVIAALLARPRRREDVDSVAGASNGPDLISNLRDLFRPVVPDRDQYIRCERVPFTDRDGKPCRPGVYSLTEKGRLLLNKWLAKRAAAIKGSQK